MAVPDDQARKELSDLFHGAVTDNPDVMAECLSILRLYNLEPSTLFYKYEAFLLSRPSGLRAKLSTLTLDTARELRKEIQREQQAKAVVSSAATPDTSKTASIGVRKGKGAMSDLGGFLDGLSTPSKTPRAKPTNPMARLSNTSNNANLPSPGSSFASPSSNAFSTPSKASPMAPAVSSYRPDPSKLSVPTANGHMTPNGKENTSAPSSPVSGAESPSALTPKPAQPFSLRPQPLSLMETLNPHLDAVTSGVPTTSKPRVSLTTSADPKRWGYRYMFEKISQRSESLDDVIDEFAEIIKDAYGITELGDPHFVSEDPIYTVGRILSPPTDNSKINAGSLYLESSRLLGSGKRVALKFTAPSELKVRGGAPGVKGFGVFPGCLLCVKGRNGGGGTFVVDEVLLAPPSPFGQTPADELLDFQYGDKLAGQPVSLTVAVGPYTLDDDLTYAPLRALIDVAVKERPDVLVMLGPFVDYQHPMIDQGAVTQTPTEIFQDQVASQLTRLAEASPGTVILLVPSLRDMISRHVAFPQAMLDKDALGLSKRIKCLPNPCTFSINETTIAVSSIDTLFHLRKEELFTRAEEAEPSGEPESKDSMANLARHVLSQRTFYPIFPPPEAHAGEVNLDVTHQSLLRMDGPCPDIMIMPSRLKHFSKVIDSTLVLNPSFLSRAHSSGTFAKIIIHPMIRDKLESKMDIDGDGDEGDFREHEIYARARCETWRI